VFCTKIQENNQGHFKIKDNIMTKQILAALLAITGALDEWPVQAALNFFANDKRQDI
jgi:hypothetical protein